MTGLWSIGTMDLPEFCGERLAHFADLSLEGDGASGGGGTTITRGCVGVGDHGAREIGLPDRKPTRVGFGAAAELPVNL